MKKILTFLLASAALVSANLASAQVSLHGIYGQNVATGVTVLFAVHDNNTVGVWIFDFNQQKVGRDEAAISPAGTFTASEIGWAVTGTLVSTGPSSIPSVTATLTGPSTINASIARSALFGAGNADTFEGRFEGIAANPSDAHKTYVTFFIDTNFNLYFAHLRPDGSYEGGTGTVVPSSSDIAGTFTATAVDGTPISGSFTTDGSIMDGSFTLDSSSYDFQAFRIGAEHRLINMSTRGFVSTGAGVLIGGFVVEGGPKLIYIRVLGPSLANFGVSGSLTTPTVTLNSGSTEIATNTGWQTAPNESQISQVPWPPLDAGDCAILIVLEPGAYTATVSGVNSTTGIALVEVYELGTD
jgi:hypothetical protein